MKLDELRTLCAKAHEYFTFFDEVDFVRSNGRYSSLIIKTLFECIDRFGFDLRDHHLLGYDKTGGYNSIDKLFLFGAKWPWDFTPEDVVFLVWHEFGHCVDHKLNKLLLRLESDTWFVTFKSRIDDYYERPNETSARYTLEEYCNLPEEASANAFAVMHCGLPVSPPNHYYHWAAGKKKLTKDQNLAICAV